MLLKGKYNYTCRGPLEINGEDGVAARGIRVHESGASRAVVPTSLHDFVAVCHARARMHRQTCNGFRVLIFILMPVRLE